MNRDQIELLLRTLGIYKTRERANGWIESSCPFALWSHSKGRDRHPSFAISVVPNGVSGYKCHACGAKGEMGIPFLWRLERLSGRKYSGLAGLLERSNAPSLSDLSKRLDRLENGKKGLISVGGVQVPMQLFAEEPSEMPAVSEDLLQKFLALEGDVLEYLTTDKVFRAGVEEFQGRSIPLEVLNVWEIRWHAGAGRITIPLRDHAGRLIGFSGRAWPLDTKPKYLHPSGFKRDVFLYGEHRRQEGRPGILVEGQLDVINLDKFGIPNVFGMLGAYISKMQIQKLRQWVPSVVIVPDGDEAGRKGADVSRQMLEYAKVPVTVVATPDGIDPGEFTEKHVKELLTSFLTT